MMLECCALNEISPKNNLKPGLGPAGNSGFGPITWVCPTGKHKHSCLPRQCGGKLVYLGEALGGVLQQPQHFDQWTLQFRGDDCSEKSPNSKSTTWPTLPSDQTNVRVRFTLAVSSEPAHPRPATRSSSAAFWQLSRGSLRSPSSCWSTAPPCCASRYLQGGSASGSPTAPSSGWSSATPRTMGIKVRSVWSQCKGLTVSKTSYPQVISMLTCVVSFSPLGRVNF